MTFRLPWVKGPAPEEDEAVAFEPPPTGNEWTRGQQLATTAVAALLWVAVACGPVALLLHGVVASRPAEAVATTTTDPDVTAAQRRAEEFGVRVVTAWLEARRGQEDLIRALLPEAGAFRLPESGLKVSDSMAVDSVSSGEGLWAVTVAATVDDTRMVSRRFFTIPVKVSGQTVVAVSLPREVPGPQLAAAAPELDYGVALASSSALFSTAGEFLAAYIAGQGDVARFISPGADIRAVAPAPFTAVEIKDIAAHSEVPGTPRDGVQLDILVTAAAHVGPQQVSVQYPLTLTVRAGRWEVAAIRDVPLMAVKQPSATASASQAPAASSSPSPVNPSTSPTQQ